MLREEGYRVVLANSNPATIMTDPDFADRTYIEPLTPEVLARIIERERPDAVLPTLGGQTGLNVAMALYEQGLIGVPGHAGDDRRRRRGHRHRRGPRAVQGGDGRDRPRRAARRASPTRSTRRGRSSTRSACRSSSARRTSSAAAAPASPRPPSELERLAAAGIAASPIGEILVEESIAGWKEFELEVMRDRADNCVIICSIENVDPMGVHTGDSITVAPAQTLTDVEYQQMRDDAFACIRRVGVETGGSNVQFALDPVTGRQVVIEMNPRVSRSSALASKATGFPIAKIAARLAVGYTLDEIPNDITRATPASFEPVIDYVVTKIPRWAFEKLPGTTGVLGTQMQSVGEAMAIGRTFPESLQKALRSLEQGRLGLNADPAEGELADARRRRPAGRDRRPDARPHLPDRRAAAPRRHRRGDPRRLPHRPLVPRPDAGDRRGAPRARRARPARPTSTPGRGGGPSGSASPTPSSPTCGASTRPTSARPARPPASSRRTRRSTRAPPSSPPRRRTTTRRGRTRARSARRTGHA